MLKNFLIALVNGIIRLRYKLTIRGKENLEKCIQNPNRGVLFLPNHPAEMDPIILSALLWPKFHTRPLVVEHFYYLKGVGFFMKFVRALPLSHNSAQANKWRRARYEKTFESIVEGLKKGENFLVYPAGKLRTTDQEQIGGSSMVYNLIKAVPDVNIVLIRSTGLWGSRFSRALQGKVPKFGKELLESLKIILKNGIFFVPKRPVKIDIELGPKVLQAFSSRLDFNRYLENWYNKYPEKNEPLKLVSNAFWKQEFPQVKKIDQTLAPKIVKIDEKISEEIKKFISTLAHVKAETIQDTMHLSQDLGLDSLDIAQIYLFLDEKYHLEHVAPGSIQTVSDVYAAFTAKPEEEEIIPEEAKNIWPKEVGRHDPFFPEGKSIGEAFLYAADKMGDNICCQDATSGKFTYSKLKMAALLFAKRLEKSKGKYIGVMLPSSVAVQIVVQACYLAGKIPVMLNWTVGVKALDHAAAITNLDIVITSQKFLERLEDDNLGQIEKILVLLEDVRKSFTLKEKLRALITSWKSGKNLAKLCKLDELDPHSPAVILFTSGTETLPKAVPLSHHNILSNQKGALQCVKFDNQDIFFGTLPPFHSFGFTVTGLLCLLSVIKIYFFPNPTDSRGMAQEIARSKATLLCLAPSFAKNLLKASHGDELVSLRLCVLGAEKLSDELYQQLKKQMPKVKILEGYGITECSPVVTLCRPEEPLKGVGKPLPGIELCVIDPVNGAKIDPKQNGEICIKGPNVFAGYLDTEGLPRPNPFIEIEGTSWYRSGDMGHIDEDGTLILEGRLKRFVKIGGEMVGLTGLEMLIETLAERKGWKKTHEEGPAFALSFYQESTDRIKLVLYTVCDIDREALNEALREEGIGKIARISEIRKIPQIPLTGTGKTHYRLLDEQGISWTS